MRLLTLIREFLFPRKKRGIKIINNEKNIVFGSNKPMLRAIHNKSKRYSSTKGFSLKYAN